MSEDTSAENLALNLSMYQVFGFNPVRIQNVVRMSPYEPERPRCYHDFKTVMSYYNNTSQPLAVLFRDGRVLVFPEYDSGAARSHMATAFVIKTRHEGGTQVLSKAAKWMEENPGHGRTPEAQHFVDQINENDAMRRNAGGLPGTMRYDATLTETWVTLADLRSEGGTVYLHNLDIVVTTRVEDLTNIHHPHGPQSHIFLAQAMARYTNSVINPYNGHEFIGFPVLIDNADRCPQLFFVDKMGDRVMTLRAMKNPDLKDGLYFTRTAITKTPDGSPGPHLETKYFEDVDKVPADVLLVFRRFAEAENARVTPEELKARANLEEQEMKIEKLRHEKQLADRDFQNRIEILERTAEQRERENQLFQDKLKSEKKTLVLKSVLAGMSVVAAAIPLALKLASMLAVLSRKPAS